MAYIEDQAFSLTEIEICTKVQVKMVLSQFFAKKIKKFRACFVLGQKLDQTPRSIFIVKSV